MNIRPLTPALAEKARLELNEDPSRIAQDLEHLKDWIAKQPHLRARTDDQWLIVFLRGSKFSLERAKEKIDTYYAARTAASELFKIKYTDPLFEVVIRDGGFIVLPKTAAPDAPRVSLARFERIDMNKYSIIDILGSVNWLEKIAFVEDDHLTVGGAAMIMDCKGISVSHFAQITPAFIKKVSFLGQDASPLRIKGIHVVNSPMGFETIFNFMKSLIAEKNRNKFHMHSNYEDLFKYIPKNILPAEYGGDGGSTEDIVEHWLKKAKEYSAFLDEEVNFGTDEHKRVGKPKTAEALFGADGSFRKLEFD